MRCKAILVGLDAVRAFCNRANEITGEVSLVTGDGKYRVNGKSIMGCLMAEAEWGDDIWIETDGDNYFHFEDWIETAANDAANIHE